MKKYFVFLIVIIAILPQVASASWWNPLTWFQQEKVEYKNTESIQPNVVNEVESPATTTSAKEPEVVEKTVIKEVKVPVEKVVEKTVTIQDQNVVNENTDLKAKIKDLESKYNQCSASLAKLQSTISQTEAQKKVIEEKIKEIENEIYTLNNFGYMCTVSNGSSSCQNNISDQQKWPMVSQLEAKKSELQQGLLKLQ